jgi:hypothetical protein
VTPEELRAQIKPGWTVRIIDHETLSEGRDNVKVEEVREDGLLLRPSRPWSNQGRTFPRLSSHGMETWKWRWRLQGRPLQGTRLLDADGHHQPVHAGCAQNRQDVRVLRPEGVLIVTAINYKLSTESFENRYGTVADKKSPEWGREAVRRALEFLEDMGYSANEDHSPLNMDHPEQRDGDRDQDRREHVPGDRDPARGAGGGPQGCRLTGSRPGRHIRFVND